MHRRETVILQVTISQKDSLNIDNRDAMNSPQDSFNENRLDEMNRLVFIFGP